MAGWQDAPVVDAPAGAAPYPRPGRAPSWADAPVVDGAAPRVGMAGNLVAGALRGAGSIGATVLAPFDAAARAVGADNAVFGPNGLIGRTDRRAAMDAGLRALGADPESGSFAVGKLGTEIAGTMGVGGVLANGVRALGATRAMTGLEPVVQGVARGLETAGFRVGDLAGTGLGTAARIGTGAAVGGASAAMVDPSQTGTGTLVGAVAPGAVQLAGAAGNAARGLGRGVRAAVEPLTQRGQQAIASRVLLNAAGDDAASVAARLAQADALIPGSAPTAAQVAENGGIAALERAMSAGNAAQFTERGLEQAAARVAALQGIAGDDAARAAAVQARETVTGPMYDQATKAVYTMDDRLQRLLETPAMRQAMARAENIAKNQQRPFTFNVEPPDLFLGLGNNRVAATKQITGRGLQDLKMALDEMLTDPSSGYSGAAGAAIKQLRGQLLNWMEDANSAFRNARTTYSEMSRPIGQMDVGRDLLDKLGPALSDYGALGRETAGRYAQALRNADVTARNATGFRGTGMADLMTPEQLAVMENIAADLARKSNAETLGRGVGSDTFQKLVAGNLAQATGLPPRVAAALPSAVGSAVGAGVGGAVGGVPGSMVGATLGKGVDALYSRAEQKVREEVVRSLLEPRTAAQMMNTELARRAALAAPRQPMLSDPTREAIEVLFGRAAPVALSER